MTENDLYPKTECCNYQCPISLPYPVMWNPYNKVVQCHNCGHIYKPGIYKDDIEKQLNDMELKGDPDDTAQRAMKAAQEKLAKEI